jgi:hypothetical protein
MELAFWQAIERSERSADYRAYLEQFPEGAFAALARSRVAALTEAKPEAADLAGVWVSEVLTNRFEKSDRHRLRFTFKLLGDRVLGEVVRQTTPEARRQYKVAKGILDGRLEGDTLIFREPYESVSWNSKKDDWDTEKHSRAYIGVLREGKLHFVVQDSQGNPPEEFSATRP